MAGLWAAFRTLTLTCLSVAEVVVSTRRPDPTPAGSDPNHPIRMNRLCGGRCALTGAHEAIRQLGRERAGLLAVVGLQVGRRDLHAEVALAVLAFAEVAEERQQRSDLAAGEREVDAADVLAALFGGELPHRSQVEAPVPSADHEGGEAPAIEKPRRRLGLQEGSDRHAGLQPPGRRADADEVVVALACLVGHADLAGGATELRRQHPQDVEERVTKGETGEPLRIARIGELDAAQADITPAPA